MKNKMKHFIKQQKTDLIRAYKDFTPRIKQRWFFIGFIIGQLI